MEFQQPPDKIWTYEDLQQLPDDGTRYEILDGELFVMSCPSVGHQYALGELFGQLREQLMQKRLAYAVMAPFDVILSPTKVVQPDILVVRWERRKDAIGDRGAEQAPDLAIEILSPSTAKHDRVRKRRFYARNGIREYWLVDVELQTIEILELIERGLSYRVHGWYGPGEIAHSAILPFQIAVDALQPPVDE